MTHLLVRRDNAAVKGRKSLVWTRKCIRNKERRWDQESRKPGGTGHSRDLLMQLLRGG